MQALIYFQLLFLAIADRECLCPVATTIISRADAVKVANKCGDSFLPSKFNATCSASGQSQTGTREAPTITQAPVHSEEKSPQLDDGDFHPVMMTLMEATGQVDSSCSDFLRF
ncbi:hypothetical protein GOBAR_DD17695 [Gossypium barbadense]|nr:hypothetical protein GOBAR_DD17695 [Gossypium barbadense]